MVVDMEIGSFGPFRVQVARTARDRRRGLRGRDEIEPGCGILFPDARSVHTFGMRFPITVAFLDADHRVIEARTVVPGRVVWNLRARHVIEIGAGECVRLGDRLSPADPAPRTTPDAPDSAPRHRT
jgi:uncharacterized protein